LHEHMWTTPARFADNANMMTVLGCGVLAKVIANGHQL
jgi:hypothetical protein